MTDNTDQHDLTKPDYVNPDGSEVIVCGNDETLEAFIERAIEFTAPKPKVSDEQMRQESIRDIAAERRQLAEQATVAAREAHRDTGTQVRVYTAPEMMDSRTSRALRLISYLGVTFTAEDGEDAVNAFCSLLLLAGAALEEFDLAIEPVIKLAGKFRARTDVKPEVASNAVAAAILRVMPSRLSMFADDREAQRVHVVDALAMAIAKAWDDCEIAHDLRVDPLELWKVSADRLLSGEGDMLEACQPPKCAVPYAPAPLRRRP